MDIRYPANPQDFETYTTERIRSEFLIQNLFTPGRLALTYSHADRMIVGGACPKAPIPLEAEKEMGSGSFLERREMGIINVGPQGTVTADGQQFILDKTDGLYIGQGTSDVSFSSTDPENPARYYLLSGPAHKNYPTQKTTQAEAVKASLGSVAEANVRTLYKYIHPGGIPSCQLVMGMTVLETGSVWNSMPCHTHARRMEVYFYFNLPDDAIVFHLMGEPDETRHIVIRNEEAVISPDWSIHAGAGISNYIFIWGMIGENQTFTDMDVVNMAELQ
jgi:4-deoxy-L-threo-5-hexosulose-uronate ketol-isomerase